MLRTLRIVAPALAFAVLACASPRSSTPGTGVAAAGAQPASASTPDSHLVCRTERPTGSNIPRRVCYTEEQLDEMSRAAQDAHRRATQSSTQSRHD